MPGPVDFWFEFASPYGYLASHRIDKLAQGHRRSVSWRPFLLGAVFKVTGAGPLTELPMKGPYSLRDMERTAAYHGIPFKMPAPFPFLSVAPARAFYWLDQSDPGKARALAKSVYHAIFAEGRPIDRPAQVADIAAGLGLDREAILAGMGDQKMKDKLREETDRAVALGVFGSPFFFADGEPFWGNDRLDQLDRWLETGGW
jgi:2-hydroxychromene-2-carboxylate isomerase